MVVHGDDFIVAGDGDDFDWLSQNLNEKFELVQKARLGPGYDSVATVLNRCVTYSDTGLTWEVDPRHAELAVAELGLQAARPQTSPGGATPSAPLDHEELEPDGQKAYRSVSAKLAFLEANWSLMGRKLITACQREWHPWPQTDLTLHSLARNAVVQSGKQDVPTSRV